MRFLNPSDVVKYCNEDLEGIQPLQRRLQKFCDYFFQTYIKMKCTGKCRRKII